MPATDEPRPEILMELDPSEIELDRSEMGEWSYADHFAVGHNAYVFTIDFAQNVKVLSRIVTSVSLAAELCEALQRELAAYREKYGHPLSSKNDL